MSKLVDFGKAINALNEGKRIARQGWNKKGMFIFMQIPSIIPYDIVPGMQSLPDSVKKEFKRRHQNCKSDWDVDCIEMNTIKYKNQLAIVYPDNTIYGWVASPSDVLEKDWLVLD